jgi:hypothetical protein
MAGFSTNGRNAASRFEAVHFLFGGLRMEARRRI